MASQTPCRSSLQTTTTITHEAGPRPRTQEPAHRSPPPDWIDAGRAARLRGFWARAEVYQASVTPMYPRYAGLRAQLDAQARAFPRDTRVVFNFDSRRLLVKGESCAVDLRDVPDLFVSLAIIADRRQYGPRVPFSLTNLSTLVKRAHLALYESPLDCSASTLRRRFKYLWSCHPVIATALLPGMVRVNPLTDTSASEVLDGIDVLDDLIFQIEVLPLHRWVLVDVRQNLVFIQGCATPYRCPEGIEIALLCEVLNRWRLRPGAGAVKGRVLREEMAKLYLEFFGAEWEVSPRTLSRRFIRLARSTHPLRKYLIPKLGCTGGCDLLTTWAHGTAPQYPQVVWPTFPAAG